ncbi:copper resistance CopC family protein [Methylobacterium crusticola]|nr:copper resistance protein CopC [Methylobacterium crusticola]
MTVLTLLAHAVPTPAFAHAHLVSASPPVDGTVRTPPQELTIAFTEKLEEALSSIVVKDAAGRRVDAGTAHLAGDAKGLTVRLRDLPPGLYTVDWAATSVDTHRTTGRFTFTVKP